MTLNLKALRVVPQDTVTLVYVDAVLMPNGEIVCLGKTLGMFEKIKGHVYIENRKK